MTPLAQVALDFARECLGWEDAEFVNPAIWNGRFKEDSKGFHHTDLSAVMTAVKGWCDQTETSFEISYYGFVPGEWEVVVCPPFEVHSLVGEDLCHILMAACFQASRKLRGVA